jgi:hypothetical protein
MLGSLDCLFPVNNHKRVNYMKIHTRAMVSAAANTLVLLIPLAATAQHKHPHGGQQKKSRNGWRDWRDDADDEIPASHANDCPPMLCSSIYA